MAKVGRPSKFDNKMKERIKTLALKSFTEAEICHAVDIDQSCLTKWKQKFPEFFTSLKDWKIEADRNVEKSLYERASGYSCPEDKIFCKADGEIIVEKTIKHYPPDPTSMIFWLKNRQPALWRDVQKVDLTGNLMIEVVNYTDEGKDTK